MLSGFFDSNITGYDLEGMPIFDRAVDSAFFAKYFASILSNGVFMESSDALQVIAINGMKLAIKPGRCLINGYFGWQEEQQEITIDRQVDAGRIDLVVARLDLANLNINLHIVKGAPAQNPTVPIVTRPAKGENGDIYEICLAQVRINRNASQLIQANITDTRLNKSVCGIVTGLINQVDTTTLYNQIQSDLSGFKATEQAEFLAWFERMRDKLTEDAAGNLQTQLDTANSRITAINNGLTTANSRITAVNSGLTTANNNISTLQTGVNSTKNDITEIRSNLNNKLDKINGGTVVGNVNFTASLYQNGYMVGGRFTSNSSKDFYISKSGNNTTGDGTKEKPYATFTKLLSVLPKNLGGYQINIYVVASGFTQINESLSIAGFYNGIISIKPQKSASDDRVVIKGAHTIYNCWLCSVILDSIELYGEGSNVLTTNGLLMLSVRNCKIYNPTPESEGVNIQSGTGIVANAGGHISLINTMIYNCYTGVKMYDTNEKNVGNALWVENVTTTNNATNKNYVGYALDRTIVFAKHNKALMPQLGAANFSCNGTSVIYKDTVNV